MKEMLKIIKKSSNVAIIGHTSPDADCLGGVYALNLILEDLGKKCDVYVDTTKISNNLQIIFNLDENYNKDIILEDYDTIIAVDVASIGLLGKYGPAFIKHSNTIAIDHHSNRDLSAKSVFIDITKSSCCEIIYDLAIKLNAKITPQIANFLFAGLIGDTNCFLNDNTNKNSHFVAGELYSYGANTKDIIFWLRKYNNLNSINLKRLVYENMTIKNRVGYVVITSKMQKEADTDETGDVVNEILNINDNLFAFVIKQKEKNTYSVSLRCKQGYDVSIIASKFDGGGHKQASGMSFVGAPIKHSKLIYEECIKQIVN